MTDINTRGKLPFTVVSSSVNTGYAAELTSAVGQNIELVNHHRDEYGQLENSPLQGPFTNQHVGGNQHRHANLNIGTDNSDNRAEGYFVSASANSIKIYGPDIKGINKPRSLLTRDFTAKSPVNIKNIQTSGNVAGNFEYNYQVVQNVGRGLNNNLIVDGFEASGNLTTQFVSSSKQIYTLPDITRIDAEGKQYKDKTTIVQRFNAPGGKEVSSRGALDREGEELAPNNSLTTRNIKVRQPYYDRLTQHSVKPFLSKLNSLDTSLVNGNIYLSLTFGNDGLSLYATVANVTYQFNLNKKYDLSTAQYHTSFSYVVGYGAGIAFDNTGKFLYQAGTSGIIKLYNLSSPWDINTATYTSDLSGFNINISGIVFADNGNKFYTISSTSKILNCYNLTTQWVPNSADPSTTFTLDSGIQISTGIAVKNDGKYIYSTDRYDGCVYEYALSTPHDVSTAIFSKKHFLGIKEAENFDLFLDQETNQRLFIVDRTNKRIDCYVNFINDYVTEEKVNKNSFYRLKQGLVSNKFTTSSVNDNFWVQHAIPSTDLRYKWIADSVSSSQQPIQYQSYNLPYSTSSFYNSNGAFEDLQFELTGPFGDHLGISGAIDKDEMFVSTYTNTMYRDRKYFRFTTDSNQFSIDMSNISSKISNKNFTISFWINIPSNPSDIGPFPILWYGNSSGENIFRFNYKFGSTYKFEPFLQSSIKTVNTKKVITADYDDGKWHLLTLVNNKGTPSITSLFPFNSQTTKATTNLITTKVYLDAGLIYEATQTDTQIIIEHLKINSYSATLQNLLISDILIWDSSLTEEEVSNLFRITKTEYGQFPKKYNQYNLNKDVIPQPIHVYSSKLDEVNGTLFDEIGGIDASLNNFTSSFHLKPQNTGIISYSTYFNGPYQGASWKSIRNNEHPITRKLTTENTNIVSVVVPEGPHEVFKTVMGQQIRYTLPGSRKQGTILNIKESPVYINNKPLKHKFILKDSPNQNIGFELTHTYANNLQYFADKKLNDALGLGKKERQIYDTLLEYYNGSVDQNENPIERFVGYTYAETIFPKQGQALLKDVRQRIDYITDEPGYGLDGYDRQLGTQRAFWRDNKEDRMRTAKSYITSLGEQYDSSYDNFPFKTPSIAALEYVTSSVSLEYKISDFANIKRSLIDLSFKQSAELNRNFYYIDTEVIINPFQQYYSISYPSEQVPELYLFRDTLSTSRDQYNVVLASGLYPLVKTTDPSSLRASPSMVYLHGSRIITGSIQGQKTAEAVYKENTYDLGLNRFTEILSGKNPWYDCYQDYYQDVKNLSNDNLITYSTLPEFKISDNIKNLVEIYSGDITKITLDDYDDGLNFINKDSVEKDNDQFSQNSLIKFKINTVKKLLPYNGFYPQDRSIQLVNYFKQSYLDTNAIDGGLFLTGTNTELIFREDEDKLVNFLKQSSFLEPFYSPGIFYNLIKSGIATDWAVYTGSLPTSSFYVPLSERPANRISFESILDLKDIAFSSSLKNKENRYIKHKEISNEYDAGDYGVGGSISFQGFFERKSIGSPLYSLAIHNFLAETINFFLKDSKLNSFISAPETSYITFDSTKTYYMDVVLRKKDIVMCEAHSSSLSYNFGKMSGRYFGPSFWTGSAADETRISNNTGLPELLRDPGYCMYAPPYFYGDSIARLSFKPELDTAYKLDDILSNLKIENINTGFLDDTIYPSGSLYSSFVMPVESSVTIKGTIEDRQQTVDPNTGARLSITNNTGIKKWVISSKMETPVLDFSNQDFVTSSNILPKSYPDFYLNLLTSDIHTPPTASGFGRGMWSGYGKIIENDQVFGTLDKGIFIELKESFPEKLSSQYDTSTLTFRETNTGSLLQACGFHKVNSKLSNKIGELADSREISEAIVIIPYSDSTRAQQTVRIEGHNFFKIEKEIFSKQLQNISSSKSAVLSGDFGSTEDIAETSISKMIQKMSKYIIPPNFDFITNSNINPFVMYIAEFTSTLDKQDLADIWQGVMPKIATIAEREEQIISHQNSIHDFFHGKGLPKDVKFMIFKAKKRAEINYYKMTADSTDDGFFPTIQAGRPSSPYSFNWPYDYCSLVETARVDVEIDYVSGSNNI